MDTQKRFSSIATHTYQKNISALLWIGNHTELYNYTVSYLQRIFCKQDGCAHCVTCNQISHHEYPSTVWLHSERSYTTDQIEIIHSMITFKLEENEKIFFIIQKADRLSNLCANSLLKSMEEPPNGYHFIFLTEQREKILPTIQSRCLITSIRTKKKSNTENLLLPFLASTKWMDPTAFLKALNSTGPNERDSVQLFDTLLSHWITTHNEAVHSHNYAIQNEANQVITQLKKAIEEPPMTGSSKLIWKNLFLQIKSLSF